MMTRTERTPAPWKPGETVTCRGELVTFQHLAGKAAAMITRDDGIFQMVPLQTLGDRRTFVTLGQEGPSASSTAPAAATRPTPI